jgi:hypothetical protein
MPVTYTFANATAAIPLSQLDTNFATPVTIGNVAAQLGNTVASIGNLTLANVTISSGTSNGITQSNSVLSNVTINSVASTFPNNYLSNSTSTLGNATITLGGTTSSVGNLTLNLPTVTNYTETLYAPSAGSSFIISLANGTIQEITLNANGTITLPSSVAGKSFTIIVTYSGSYTLTWAGGGTLKWAGGTAPTATSANGKYDIFNFYQDGTNTYGSTFGLNY